MMFGTCYAYETDQYSHRDVSVPDSLVHMDSYVNSRLQTIIDEWQGPRDDLRLARKIYHKLGGWHWVDKIERWALDSQKVSKYPQVRRTSIYRGMPIWATRVNFVFGIGRSFRVNGVMVGTDKFGHFFSQGLKYYKRELKGWDSARVLKRGAFGERWLWGQLTTGVFANADLVANYEGMLFYKSLNEDGVIGDNPAIVRWQGDIPHLHRPFTWRDHVNDYWDEALNPSYLVKSLQRRMVPAIYGLCQAYLDSPDQFVSRHDESLWQRYKHLGLKDARQNQFQQVCGRSVAADSL